MNNAASKQALSGEFIPSENQPKALGFDVAKGADVTVIYPASALRQNAIKWVDRMQSMMQQGRQKTLAGLIEALEPNLKKAVFVAAQLTRDDLNTPIDQLTGEQRHKLFIGIKGLNQFIQQLQKYGLYCVTAFNIGENATLQPATESELAQIQQLKALRQQQNKERIAQQQQEYEQQLSANG
jgi:hypothetical protein